MGDTRFFHLTCGEARELQSATFDLERDLQDIFEKHLHALTGVHFLASEYSTGQRHSRRIDTLGIDDAGAPVVIEYKRRNNENVINQGLDYLDWLEDHKAEFRELVRKKLGSGPAVDFRTPRLLCIAGEFPRQDKVTARDSRRRIELLRYRRYGDAYIALEWVYGEAGAPPRPATASAASQQPTAPARRPATSSSGSSAEDRDYSTCQLWKKSSEATRALFQKLDTRVKSIGNVETSPSKTQISYKRSDVPGHQRVIAYVIDMYARKPGIRLIIHEKHLRDIPSDEFTHPYDNGKYREFVVRNDEDVARVEPLLRAAYENLAGSPDGP